MARIAGVDLPAKKRAEIGLTYIYGIGRKRSNDILSSSGVSGDIRVKDLSEEDVRKIRRTLRVRRRKAVTLVEELSIRTQKVQPLMRKLEQISARMAELERQIEEMRGNRSLKEDRANLVAATQRAADRGFPCIGWQLPDALWSFFFLRSYWADWRETHQTGLAAAPAQLSPDVNVGSRRSRSA